MDTKELKVKIKHIVERATVLKNKHFHTKNMPVNYACIFSQSKSEYYGLVKVAKKMGMVVKETPTGLLFHIKPIKTVSGVLKLLKIRLPDVTRPEWGDADFTISHFSDFKKKYILKRGFKSIPRENFEMVELVDSKFEVRVYFSNPPLDQQLKIK